MSYFSCLNQEKLAKNRVFFQTKNETKSTQSLRNHAVPRAQAEDTQKPTQSVPVTALSKGGEPKVSPTYKVRYVDAPYVITQHAASYGVRTDGCHFN